MSTDLAATGGAPLQGTVVPGTGNGNGHSPSQMDLTAHAFFNVLRHLVRSAPHVNEQEVDAALQIVNDFETHTLESPVAHVTQETDIAPREDVSQRAAPQAGTALAPVAGPPLDYNRLAAALLAAQQAQNTPPPGGEGTGSEPA